MWGYFANFADKKICPLMKYKLDIRTIWEAGQRTDSAGNPHQEDNLFPRHGSARVSDRLFIIADGMGGHAAGEVASEAVVSAMSEVIASPALAAEGDFPVSVFSTALAKAYDALDRIPCESSRKPGTTLALLKLHAAGATIAHIGDSRVYHIRPGKDGESTQILHRTSDHSLVNDLVRMGELTEEQARHSSQRNVITRAMQPGLDPRPNADLYATSDIRPGDWFYLCSDGMLEQMDDAALRDIFSQAGGDIDQKREILLRATEGNSDNHTAIIVEIKGVDYSAERVSTSVVTPEMQQAAKAVEMAVEASESARAGNRGSNGAHNVKKNSTWLIWLLAALTLVLAAVAVWFGCIKDSDAAENPPATHQTQILPSTPIENQDIVTPSASEATEATPKRSERQAAPQAPEQKPSPAPIAEPKAPATPAEPKLPKAGENNTDNSDQEINRRKSEPKLPPKSEGIPI